MLRTDEFLNLVKPEKEKFFVIGTVTNADPFEVRLDGYDTSQAMKRLDSYSPSKDDRVLIALVKNRHVVLGKIV